MLNMPNYDVESKYYYVKQISLVKQINMKRMN